MRFLLLFLCLFFSYSTLLAQWSNRYPKVSGYGHHVYLEGFELPVLNPGPTDPAPGPTLAANKIAFAARGWLWVMDLEGQEATRITFSAGIDSSPAWSPNGEKIAFIRDEGDDTSLWMVDMITKKETLLADSQALELDPYFDADGTTVYYASAEKGPIDLWKVDINTLKKTSITHNMGVGNQLERQPVPGRDASFILYLRKKQFSFDAIEKMVLADSSVTVLAEESFASQLAFDLSPDQHTLAYTWPQEDNYVIRLLDVNRPESTLILTKSNGLPLKPKFSADGQWVYYMEFGKDERSTLKRISVHGGQAETIEISGWNWGVPTTALTIRSIVDETMGPVRMSVTTASGHPILPDATTIHSDGQSGRVFFYSPGEITLTGPAGEWVVTAVQGLSTPLASTNITAVEGQQNTQISLNTIWDSRANGWYSGDNHFHLNYGGTYQLEPEDLALNMKGEQLDMAWPLLANLHNRFLEQDLWGWENKGEPLIRFGQEVRSHFLGHLNLIGTEELYWPWVWGPSYEVYGKDDRLNALPLRFAKEKGGLGGYVHPIGARDPFADTTPPPYMPVAMTADAILGEIDLLEVACLWTDEIGTAAFWHAILNLGIPLAASAGSDVMADYYRTMAAGSTRAYVKPDGPFTEASYLKALKEGKSFVTNGPMVEFMVSDQGPGGVLPVGGDKVRWKLDVHSPIAYEMVEIFINGKVVYSRKGNDESGSKSFRGSLSVPEAGWLTARVSGGESSWPMMDSYPYAETSPIWIGSVGSIDSDAAKSSAQDLLRSLNASEDRLKRGYGDTPIPRLMEHFQEAREKLEAIISN